MKEFSVWSQLSRITLMIMINAIVLTHSSAAREIIQIPRDAFSSQITSGYQWSSPDKMSNSLRHFTGRNGRKMKKLRHWRPLNLVLKQIFIRMRNVIDRHDFRKKELEALYQGVVVCGRNKCGKFRELIPENQLLKGFQCKKFKNLNILKKHILILLSGFHNGVKLIDDIFQHLIYLEERPHLKIQDKSKGSRLRILKELQTDVNTLTTEIIDIETVTKTKRLNFPRQQKRLAETLNPSSQTVLMINEWRNIQSSKEFLKAWRKNIRTMIKCWKEWKPK